jgi:hemoglobin
MATMSDDSLYDRLGGRDAIRVVVDDFYDRVLDDERLRPYFEDVSMDRLRSHQIQFLAAATGGPVDYAREDLRAAHAEMGIDESEFEAVATHLDAALEDAGVARPDRRDVMETVEGLEGAIVAD